MKNTDRLIWSHLFQSKSIRSLNLMTTVTTNAIDTMTTAIQVVRALGKVPGSEAVEQLSSYIEKTPEKPPRQSRREAEAIIESFNLAGFNRTIIDGHLKKLFGYDPSGLGRNFIVVYCYDVCVIIG